MQKGEVKQKFTIQKYKDEITKQLSRIKEMENSSSNTQLQE